METTLLDKARTVERCPRCNGPMFADYDGRYSAFLCLLCGEYVFPEPPRPRGAVPSETRRCQPALVSGPAEEQSRNECRGRGY